MSPLTKLKAQTLFVHDIQVEFTFEEIAFTTNNKVALLYPSHPNQEYFKDVSDIISKCCQKEAFTRAPTQYKEYLSEFWYTAKTLPDFKIWVSTPTGEVREEIGYNREIGVKETLKKSCLPPRWRLLMGQIIQCLCGKIGGLNQISNKDATIMFISLLLEHKAPKYDKEELTINPTQAICNLDVPVDSKAPKYSSQTEEETKSSSAKDKSPNHPSPPTPVVGEMHKEAHQAAGGLTSLRATSEEGAHPQLSSVVSKVDRLEYAYLVYPILPAILTQSKSYRRWNSLKVRSLSRLSNWLWRK
ncbi:hypothetical protein Tco_0792794 [Tanacetum coccineum]